MNKMVLLEMIYIIIDIKYRYYCDKSIKTSIDDKTNIGMHNILWSKRAKICKSMDRFIRYLAYCW